ncbi:hypothetical protein AC249_AIPGENE24333, partial [Exaiptasia diaphana]
FTWTRFAIKMSKKVSAAETLNQLTNAHAVRGRLTLKDVNGRKFRNESFRELKRSKNTQKYSKQTQKYSKKTQKYSKNTQKYSNVEENTNSLVNSSHKKTKDCSNYRRNNNISHRESTKDRECSQT